MMKKDSKQKQSKSKKGLDKEEAVVVRKRGRPRKDREPLVEDNDNPKDIRDVKIKKVYYVNSEEFSRNILESYKTNSITEDTGRDIVNIATRLSWSPRFINYSYKEEMIGDAIIKMLTAIKNKKFDPTRGFPSFSYFNAIAFNAFRNRIKKEKREKEFIYAVQDSVYSEIENGGIHNTAGKRSEELYE